MLTVTERWLNQSVRISACEIGSATVQDWFGPEQIILVQDWFERRIVPTGRSGGNRGKECGTSFSVKVPTINISYNSLTPPGNHVCSILMLH